LNHPPPGGLLTGEGGDMDRRFSGRVEEDLARARYLELLRHGLRQAELFGDVARKPRGRRVGQRFLARRTAYVAGS